MTTKNWLWANNVTLIFGTVLLLSLFCIHGTDGVDSFPVVKKTEPLNSTDNGGAGGESDDADMRKRRQVLWDRRRHGSAEHFRGSWEHSHYDSAERYRGGWYAPPHHYYHSPRYYDYNYLHPTSYNREDWWDQPFWARVVAARRK